MSGASKPLPVVSRGEMYHVFVQWSDGPGGTHLAKNWGEAIDHAEALARSGFGSSAKGQRIIIKHVVCKQWHFDDEAIAAVQLAATPEPRDE